MTADLVSSLSSALDKREQIARAAHDPAGWNYPRIEACWDGGFEADDDILAHIAANSPEWVLRDCEAKRRVLERHRRRPLLEPPSCRCDACVDNYLDIEVCDGCQWTSEDDKPWPCPEIRDLAYALGVEVPE